MIRFSGLPKLLFSTIEFAATPVSPPRIVAIPLVDRGTQLPSVLVLYRTDERSPCDSKAPKAVFFHKFNQNVLKDFLAAAIPIG